MEYDIHLFHSYIGIFFIGLLGLVVGSFLNVVIYRLPLMMERAEKVYAWEVLNDDKNKKNPYDKGETFNLMYPPSRCPHCGALIRFWQNIPIVSYLWQRGRCAGCGTSITVRYLLVELLCAFLSMLVVLKYPEPWQLIFALLLTWGLIALFFIDAETQLLPDTLTLPLMWLGIIVACIPRGSFISLQDSVIGAVIGYLSLWSVYWLFRIITGKEGIGYGDFKLLALLCAWQGILFLPFILLVSALSGLAFAIVSHIGRGVPMPFGPHLIIAGWLTFMYGGKLAAVSGLFF